MAAPGARSTRSRPSTTPARPSSPRASRRGRGRSRSSSVLPEWGTAKVTTGWLRIAAGGTVVLRPAAPDRPREVLGLLPGGGPHGGRRPRPEEDGRRADLLQAALFQAPARRPPGERAGLPDRPRRGDRLVARSRPRRDLLRHARPPPGHHPLRPGGQGRRGRHVAVLGPRQRLSVPPSFARRRPGQGPRRPRGLAGRRPPRSSSAGRRRAARESAGRSPSRPSRPRRPGPRSSSSTAGRAGSSNVVFESEWEKEADYLALVELAATWRGLFEAGLVADPFRYPGPRRRHAPAALSVAGEGRAAARRPGRRPPSAALGRRAAPPVPPRPGRADRDHPRHHLPGHGRGHRPPPGRAPRASGATSAAAPTKAATCRSSSSSCRSGRYVSLPRLVTFKPTLQAVARQHANEVSSTNYLLRFAELLARDRPRPGRRSRR